MSKSWQGTDLKYYTQYSYSFTYHGITEVGTFEVNNNAIMASARIWDPVAVLFLHRIISSLARASILSPRFNPTR
jgi:hypothetical protein